jgi:hypothetical protein
VRWCHVRRYGTVGPTAFSAGTIGSATRSHFLLLVQIHPFETGSVFSSRPDYRLQVHVEMTQNVALGYFQEVVGCASDEVIDIRSVSNALFFFLTIITENVLLFSILENFLNITASVTQCLAVQTCCGATRK